MTIKKLMMAAGAVVSDPQVIAPSSNDFDYTFDGGGEWPVAGNPLGDHTIGAYVNDVGGDSGIFCLHTLDGDFDITATLTDSTDMGMGVAEITNDSNRVASDDIGMYGASIESWMWTEVSQGAGANRFHHGNTDRGSYTYADGDVLKIERRGGVITFYKNDAEALEFPETSSNPVRMFIFSEGGSFPSDIDNILITDYEKVQRDGTLNYAQSGTASYGDGASGTHKHMGTRFLATRSGYVTDMKFRLVSTATSFTSKAGLYADGTNPGSQIGSDSDGVTVTGSTTSLSHPFSSTNAVVEKGTYYWAVWSDQGTAGSCATSRHAGRGTSQGTGTSNTVGGISDADGSDQRFEVVVNTSDGEPTPDHDTLLLVHCNGANGNTSFTDSSPFGRTITTVDGAHHDSGQAKFGSTSLYCDGTNDSITIPDSLDWTFPNSGHFTVEFWVYFNGTPGNNTHICGQGTDNRSSYSFIFRCEASGNFFAGSSDGSTGSSITCSTDLSSAWHHVALVYNGILKLYIDGTSEGTPITHTNAVQNVAYPFEFGGGNNSASHINAWFDEIRISRVARWDANFTPPTSAYP
tara:strand:+ start:5812 stop:7542 length:1731 start_codon:yes stop_codon:yes gene_type:complete